MGLWVIEKLLPDRTVSTLQLSVINSRASYLVQDVVVDAYGFFQLLQARSVPSLKPLFLVLFRPKEFDG